MSPKSSAAPHPIRHCLTWRSLGHVVGGRHGWRIGRLGWAAALSALLFAVPILIIVGLSFSGTQDTWSHLYQHVLPGYIRSSLLLLVGVSVGVLLMGVPTAWLTSVCEFPGRRVFNWALLLPLAIPGYIIAYTYTGLLDYYGPVQSLFRDITGLGYREYWFPRVRSLGGAMIMLSLVLYPYVYLLARAAFIEQSICVLEASRSLGKTPLQSFWRVALPLARPAIITGLTLALMETLADYGVVEYFGVSTFTTGIFRTWTGLGDEAATAQLAIVLLTFVVLLVVLERYSRRKSRVHHTSNRYATIQRYPLRGSLRLVAWLICGLPVVLGFLLPVTVLVYWSLTLAEPLNPAFLKLVWHTLVLGAISASAAIFFGLIASYSQRYARSWLVKSAVGLTSMGYALPGMVIAIGVLIPLAWLDHRLIEVSQALFDRHFGLILSGSIIALLYAYVVRFLSVAINTMASGLEKIKPSMDEAARSMGKTPFQVLRQVHFPMMRSTVLTAYLLVFVEVLKELPATIILRPMNFNTLAVRAHEMASDERLIDAGPPALTIVLVGLLPVILLSREIARGRAGRAGQQETERA